MVTGTREVKVEVNRVVEELSQVDHTVEEPRVPTEVEHGTKVVFVIVSVSVVVLHWLTLLVAVVMDSMGTEVVVVVVTPVESGGGTPVPVPECLRSTQ